MRRLAPHDPVSMRQRATRSPNLAFAAATVAGAVLLAACGADAPVLTEPLPTETVTTTPSESPSETEPTPEPTATAEPDGSALVHATGLGAIRIGMTPAEAGAALGHELVAQSDYEDFRAELECGYLNAPEASGLPDSLGFMVTGVGVGVISRIDVYEAGISAAVGDDRLGIGSTLAEVRGVDAMRIEEHPNTYSDTIVDVAVFLSEDDDAPFYVFEVDTERGVTAFRVGRSPEVGFVEGCL